MRHLGLRQLTQSFGRFQALKDVTLSLKAGEVVGIVGENGAGKSTVLNLWSGTLQPSTGAVTIDHEHVVLRSYHEANLRGIWRIFQDPAQIGSLPVYENLFLGHERHFLRWGVLAKRAMVRAAREVAGAMLLDVDVLTPTQSYDFATRQVLEVARAILLPKILGLPAGFVLFDEPTTGLTRTETDRLVNEMSRLRFAGAGVAFVSHRLEELFAVCDRLVVLRDGVLVADGVASDFEEASLQRLMVGRNVRKVAPTVARPEAGTPPRFIVSEITSSASEETAGAQRSSNIRALTFTALPGEIIGIGGLLGSGKGRLLRMLAGLVPVDAGEIRLDGVPLRGQLRRHIKRGVAFISSDRPGEALTPSQSVAFNIALPSGAVGARGFSTRLGLWRQGFQAKIAGEMIVSFGIKAQAAQRVQSLSGGNQQKVAVARWTHRRPSVLLVENPTAGVDVGAKLELHRLLRELAASGTTIIFVSDDLPELIELSDRILIMRDGTLAANIRNATRDASEHELVGLMIGSQSAAPASHSNLALVQAL